MADKLVATGDTDADAILRIAREIHGLDVALANATELLEAGHSRGSVQWPPAITDRSPLGYESAQSVVEQAPELMEQAWEQIHQHHQVAKECDPATAALVDLHVCLTFDPHYKEDQ